MDSSILKVSDITVDRRGNSVLNNISLNIDRGDIHFLIGPKGAGKTAVLDLISGKVKPDSGKVFFKNQLDISGYSENDISNLGIYRKSKNASIFPGITIYENMELAAMKKRSLYSSVFRKLSKEQMEKIQYLLDSIGLYEVRYRTPAVLSEGEKQWLDIARLLVHSPELILMEGLFQGMKKEEVEKTGKILKKFSKECTMVVAESKREFIKHYISRITVLHQGKVFEEGHVEQILNSDKVRSIIG